MKRALITGIGGQDGSYLADILLEKGYEVHGLVRHSSTGNLRNISHLLSSITVHRGDVLDSNLLQRIIREVDPREIYHEADQDNVDWSYSAPGYQVDITVKSVSTILETVLREHTPSYRPKVFIPVSATMFGNSFAPQNEESKINPLNPYACGKAAAFHLARYYRQVYGMFVSTAILYNHDSPRRHGKEYLLHKICRAAANKQELTLYNMDEFVDIGYAHDYMKCVYALMQDSTPEDYVICAQYARSIRHIAEFAFRIAGLNYKDFVTEKTIPTRPGPSETLIGNMTKFTSKFPNVVKFSLFDDIINYLIKKYRSE